MADHKELVSEMVLLEQMGTQERQKLAKKRRLQQLKKWSQREKEYMAKEKQINKRLANMINEENNGLNLKQYTSYNSNNRTKTKITSNKTSNDKFNNNNDYNINNNHQSQNNNYQNLPSSEQKSYQQHQHQQQHLNGNGQQAKVVALENLETCKQLSPNGKVHFSVGVMLLEAAARNDYDEVKRLLMLGVSPDSVNHDGLTALHQCCIDASEPMMNLLLEFGANVDARDTEQWTPLHAACTCGHLNLVKILVENGADLLAVNGDGNMPFDACEDEATLTYIESQMVERGITQEMIDITRASSEMQMISDLEKAVNDKADLNQVFINEKDNITLLHVAAANGYLSAVKFLLEHGANVNACDSDLWTPLHGAVCWGSEQHIAIVELLIESGAHLEAKTINEETVFDLCDNAELLERLNQIKDELESKQAAATAGGEDRLKRSQSRTNSRVHSVRRTSVRDKNQISRREAREEAMLRVESNSSLYKAPNGEVAATRVDEVTSKEEIDNTIKNGVDKILPTNLGDNDTLKELEINQRSQKTTSVSSSSAHSSANSLVIVSTDNKKNLVEETRKQLQQNSTTRENIKPNSTKAAPLTTVTLLNGSSTSPHEKSIVKNTQPNRKSTHHSNISEHVSNFDTTDNGAAQVPTSDNMTKSTSNVAFIAPINYTLSNLKKQRSDLRMRNSTIGGGSLIATTSTVKTSHGISVSASNGLSVPQGIVEMNPSSTSKSVDSATNTKPTNGLQSPSLTMRKFSGEPSETVGGKKSKQHSCCILI